MARSKRVLTTVRLIRTRGLFPTQVVSVVPRITIRDASNRRYQSLWRHDSSIPLRVTAAAFQTYMLPTLCTCWNLIAVAHTSSRHQSQDHVLPRRSIVRALSAGHVTARLDTAQGTTLILSDSLFPAPRFSRFAAPGCSSPSSLSHMYQRLYMTKPGPGRA